MGKTRIESYLLSFFPRLILMHKWGPIFYHYPVSMTDAEKQIQLFRRTSEVLSTVILINLYKIVYLVYRGFWVSFDQVGTGVTCPPISVFSAPFYPVWTLCLWWLVVGGCMCGIGVSEGVGCYCDPWCSYLNRFIPAPYYHCGRCTLIRCAITWDTHMQRWVEHTKVIAILLLTYPHVFK